MTLRAGKSFPQLRRSYLSNTSSRSERLVFPRSDPGNPFTNDTVFQGRRNASIREQSLQGRRAARAATRARAGNSSTLWPAQSAPAGSPSSPTAQRAIRAQKSLP